MPQTLLTRDQIKNAKDLKHEDVEVPEWGGTIRIQQMNAGETNVFTAELETMKGDGMYLMLVHSARDLKGKRIFTKDDILWLRDKNIGVLNRLQRKALELNKMTAVAEVALKKDSSEAAAGGTPTP